ncbi:hypothetical protein [Metabacillus sp. 84]|uniref:hypothetical protein n=1 Tax=Metabacillus sp. 84 TaxID=3404705 RepID=UPI003CE93225
MDLLLYRSREQEQLTASPFYIRNGGAGGGALVGSESENVRLDLPKCGMVSYQGTAVNGKPLSNRMDRGSGIWHMLLVTRNE